MKEIFITHYQREKENFYFAQIFQDRQNDGYYLDKEGDFSSVYDALTNKYKFNSYRYCNQKVCQAFPKVREISVGENDSIQRNCRVMKKYLVKD